MARAASASGGAILLTRGWGLIGSDLHRGQHGTSSARSYDALATPCCATRAGTCLQAAALASAPPVRRLLRCSLTARRPRGSTGARRKALVLSPVRYSEVEPAIPAADGDAYQPQPAPTPRPRTLDWQSFLARIYGPSALRCDRCQERLEVIAFIEDRKVVRKVLEHLGLATTGPPQAPARPRPQRELFC